MPTYLVEAYLPDSPDAFDRARLSAGSAARPENGIRHLRTTFVPGDELILHVFEVPTAEALPSAGKLAELRFERIVEAVEGQATV